MPKQLFYINILNTKQQVLMSIEARISQAVAQTRQSNIIGSNNAMYNVETGNNRKIFILKQQRMSMLLAEDQQFNQTIELSSFFAWAVLFLNSLFASFVPCWLMGDVRSQSFTRNSWRFTTVSVLLIPFLFYEQRNVKSESQKLINLLTKQKLKPIFISTINYCIWLLLLINACRWTSMNHAVCLSDLKFLVISLFKFMRREKFHQFEVGGSMIAVIGIMLIFIDSLTMPQAFNYQSQKYLRTQPWKRFILGDGLAVLGSFASFYLDKFYKAPQMPRFTYLFIYNVFLTFNLITFGYFFGGSQFSFNPKFGVFGLYTSTNFVSVFYVSIMLGLTLIMTNIIVRQVFSQLIIDITSRFEVVETSVIYHVLRLQLVPSGLTCLGYSFIVPGLVFILCGKAALQNKQINLNFQLFRPMQRQQSRRFSRLNTITNSANNTHSPNISPINKSLNGPEAKTGIRTTSLNSGTQNVNKKNMPFLQILEEEEIVDRRKKQQTEKQT